MKFFPILLALAFGIAQADEPRSCEVSGWLKMRPVPNAGGDEYGNPDWPAQVRLYPTAASRDVLETLPDALSAAKWDYLLVNLNGRAQHGRFPVQIEAYGAAPPIAPVAGWLDAEHIGFTLQTGILYAQADSKSEKKLALADQDWLEELGSITLRDCDREWVQVDYRQTSRRDSQSGERVELPGNKQKTLSGVWARGVCSTLETTCDMPSVDEKT